MATGRFEALSPAVVEQVPQEGCVLSQVDVWDARSQCAHLGLQL